MDDKVQVITDKNKDNHRQIVKDHIESQERIAKDSDRVLSKAKVKLQTEIRLEREKLEIQLKALKEEDQKVLTDFNNIEKGLDQEMDKIMDELMDSDKEEKNVHKYESDIKAKDKQIDSKYDELRKAEYKQIWDQTIEELNIVFIKHKNKVKDMEEKMKTDRNEEKNDLKITVSKNTTVVDLKAQRKLINEKKAKNISEFKNKSKRIKSEIDQKLTEISKLAQSECERLVHLIDKSVNQENTERKNEMELFRNKFN